MTTGMSTKEYAARDALHSRGHRMDRRKAADEDGRLPEAEHCSQHGQQRERRQGLAPGNAGDDADADEREQGSADRGGAQTLLLLEHGEQQSRKRNEREDRLPEARVDPDECVVGEAERPAEEQRAVQECSEQRAVTRKREPQHGGHRAEEAGCEQEPKARAPERIELAVADPHAHGVPSRQHRTDDEGRERPAVAVAAHDRVSSETVSTCGVCGNMSTGFVRTSS